MHATSTIWLLILVTGGAGFIGSHLTEELVHRGHAVRVVDNLATGKRRNLDHISGVEFMEGDLANMDVAARAVAGMDYVLHQAAIPSVPKSVKDPVTSNRANIDATLNVLVAARDAGVKRLVFAGSSSDAATRQRCQSVKIWRRACCRPTRCRKSSAPRTVGCSPSCTASRPSSSATSTSSDRGRIQGRRTRASSRSFRPRSSKGASRSSTVTASRHATSPYVANVVDGVLRACESPNAAGEAINVACGTRISLNELLRVMNKIVGTEIHALYKDSRAGDVKDSQADISKARQLLGYTPIVGLEEGLKQTLAWCRSESGAPASR